jgi:subtilisin family serine protease
MRAFAKAAVLAAAVMIGAHSPAFSQATNAPPPVISSLGTPTPPHAHGTAIAGAIAANSKLVGVAPKVRLLAMRAFSGAGESAQSTTFNILKGIDWAAAKNARIINMSFAGPADPMLRQMLAIANGRGIVLIAAVDNAGPKSPPLYPGADAGVIGVTATDADES